MFPGITSDADFIYHWRKVENIASKIPDSMYVLILNDNWD